MLGWDRIDGTKCGQNQKCDFAQKFIHLNDSFVLCCPTAYPPLVASYFSGWNIEPRHDGRSSNLCLKDLARARLKPATQWVTNWLPTTESGDMVIEESGDMVFDEGEDMVINSSGDIDDEKSGDIDNEKSGDIDNEKSGDIVNEESGDIVNEESGDNVNKESGDIVNKESGDIDIDESWNIVIEWGLRR